MLFHEDAGPINMTKPGPSYNYKDVSMKGIPYNNLPDIKELANQFACKCNVTSWNIEINVVHLTSILMSTNTICHRR